MEYIKNIFYGIVATITKGLTRGVSATLLNNFFKHVENEEFKSQEIVAQMLQTVDSANTTYVCWEVISLLLQVTQGPESNTAEQKSLYFSLAERKMYKLLKQNNELQDNEMKLYIQVLQLQCKHEEALTAAKRVWTQTADIFKIELLLNAEEWEELKLLLEQLILKNYDRWDFFQHYLSCGFKHKPSNELNGSAVDETIVAAGDQSCYLNEYLQFIEKIMELSKSKYRAPYLARLEFYKRQFKERMSASTDLMDFTNMLLHYFRLFAHRPCCTQDMSLFLDCLDLKQRQWLVNELLAEIDMNGTALPRNLEQQQRHANALQISRICGINFKTDSQQLLDFCGTLKQYYEHGHRLFEQHLPIYTDKTTSDTFAVLAANVLYDLAMQEKRASYLLSALYLLQHILTRFKFNVAAKLYSMKIYHMLGCQLGANRMYQGLKIENILLESMSHAHCNLLLQCGHDSMTRSILRQVVKLHTKFHEYHMEHMKLAYENFSFDGIQDFMRLKRRLKNSFLHAMTLVELNVLKVMHFSHAAKENLQIFEAFNIQSDDEDKLERNDFWDNRDLTAPANCDQLAAAIDVEKQQSFEQEEHILRIRSLMLRLTAAMLQLFTGGSKLQAYKTENIEQLQKQWTNLFRKLHEQQYGPLPNQYLSSLLPTRLHLLLQKTYESFFNSLIQLALHFYNGSQLLVMQCKLICDEMDRIVDDCARMVNKINSDSMEDVLWHRRTCQQQVASYIELLSFCTFVLTVLQLKLPQHLKTKNYRNKTDQTLSDTEQMQLLSELMLYLKVKLQQMQILLTKWTAPSLPADTVNEQQEFASSIRDEVAKSFKESHKIFINNLQTLLNYKISMLKAE